MFQQVTRKVGFARIVRGRVSITIHLFAIIHCDRISRAPYGRPKGAWHTCEREKRDRLGFNFGDGDRAPVSGVPASGIRRVEPNLRQDQAVVPRWPRPQWAPGSIVRVGSAEKQEIAIDRYARRRGINTVSGERRQLI